MLNFFNTYRAYQLQFHFMQHPYSCTCMFLLILINSLFYNKLRKCPALLNGGLSFQMNLLVILLVWSHYLLQLPYSKHTHNSHRSQMSHTQTQYDTGRYFNSEVKAMSPRWGQVLIFVSVAHAAYKGQAYWEWQIWVNTIVSVACKARIHRIQIVLTFY